MPAVLYTASVVCPMDQPPFADGGVLVEGGMIAAVGDAAPLRADAVAVHHIPGVLLPGFVNAHTHLEHGDAAALAQPGPELAWLDALDAQLAAWDQERWSRSAFRGVQALLRGGATAVGDVVSRGPGVPAASNLKLPGNSWIEVRDVDWTHHDSVLAQVEAALDLPGRGRAIGIAPAAPVALSTGVLQALAALAQRRGVSLHSHAAQSEHEAQAIMQGSGPLADRVRRRGLDAEWLDGGTGLSPIAYLDACGALFPGASVAHGVWLHAGDAQLLAERGTTVVICPEANTLHAHGTPPLEWYAQAGTKMALGSESAASAPEQDMLRQAALWVAMARQRGLADWPHADGARSLSEQAVRLLTVAGADAMGWQTGTLSVGARADMVGITVDTNPAQVFDDVVQHGAGQVLCTVVAGIRKARREPGTPWTPIDRQEWRT